MIFVILGIILVLTVLFGIFFHPAALIASFVDLLSIIVLAILMVKQVI